MMYEPMLCKLYDQKYITPEYNYIYQEKLNGYHACMEIGPQGSKVFLSRDGHEITHLVPELAKVKSKFSKWVIDGEIVVPTGEFKHLQGLCGSKTLPETAEKNRKKYGHPIFHAYDCMYAAGDIRNNSFGYRYLQLSYFFKEACTDFIKLVENVPLNSNDDVYEITKNYIKQGKEGIVIKSISAPYESGKKSKFCLKLKGELTLDVVIMDFATPTKEYKGKAKMWKFWEDSKGQLFEQSLTIGHNDFTPITKPYFMGYAGAIEFGVYKTIIHKDPLFGDYYESRKLVKVGECRGFSDEVAEFIKQNNPIGATIEVTAQEIIDKNTGSLRHPRFSRFRDDKPAKECTWESYIEK